MGRLAQTLCVTQIIYAGSDAFEPDLPPGVGASDQILHEIEFWVVLKV